MSVIVGSLAIVASAVVLVMRLPVLLEVERALVWVVVVAVAIVPVESPTLIGILLIPMWLTNGRLEVGILALITDLMIEVLLTMINWPNLIIAIAVKVRSTREVAVATISLLISSVATSATAAVVLILESRIFSPIPRVRWS